VCFLSVDVGVLGKNQLVAPIEGFFHFLVLFRGQLNKHAGSWALGLAGFTNLSSALDVDVRSILLFAKNRQVREDIDWRDVSSNYNNATKES